jgi:hypothetical protein
MKVLMLAACLALSTLACDVARGAGLGLRRTYLFEGVARRTARRQASYKWYGLQPSATVGPSAACNKLKVDQVLYFSCLGPYYRPFFDGLELYYEVVPAPDV